MSISTSVDVYGSHGWKELSHIVGIFSENLKSDFCMTSIPLSDIVNCTVVLAITEFSAWLHPGHDKKMATCS